jgi:hypothetical protein
MLGAGYDYPDLPGLGNNNEKLGLPERLSTGVIESFFPRSVPPPEKWLGGKTTIGALQSHFFPIASFPPRKNHYIVGFPPRKNGYIVEFPTPPPGRMDI